MVSAERAQSRTFLDNRIRKTVQQVPRGLSRLSCTPYHRRSLGGCDDHFRMTSFRCLSKGTSVATRQTHGPTPCTNIPRVKGRTFCARKHRWFSRGLRAHVRRFGTGTGCYHPARLRSRVRSIGYRCRTQRSFRCMSPPCEVHLVVLQERCAWPPAIYSSYVVGGRGAGLSTAYRSASFGAFLRRGL